MLEVMLCGAEDTQAVAGQFAEVVRAFGGDPWHYLAGHVVHINSAGASWATNSRVTVQRADLCVFVVMERYGDITWTVELNTALSTGKPFLIFCLRDTYQKYITLQRSITDPTAIANEGDRRLVATLRELEADRQLTVVPFEHGYFKAELQRQLAALFSQTLQVLAERNQRARLLGVLSDGQRLSATDRQLLAALATDETEDKNSRKRAIIALSESGGLDQEDMRSVLESMEEGVQRLAISLLPELTRGHDPDADFMGFCVSVANNSDDVGVGRRLIPALFAIDVGTALDALEALSLQDIGARRRLASALEEYEAEIVGIGMKPSAAVLASRCLVASTEAGWLQRCRELLERLTEEDE